MAQSILHQNLPLITDGVLGRFGSDKLKSMVRVWGGSTTLHKSEWIDQIRAGLADPEKVRAACP